MSETPCWARDVALWAGPRAGGRPVSIVRGPSVRWEERSGEVLRLLRGELASARAGVCALTEAPHCPWRVPAPRLPPAGPAVRIVGRRTPAAPVLQPQGSQFSPSFQNHLFIDFSLFFLAFILLSSDLRFPSSLR